LDQLTSMARELRIFRCGDYKSVQPTRWQSYQLSTIREVPSLKLKARKSIPKVALTLAKKKNAAVLL